MKKIKSDKMILATPVIPLNSEIFDQKKVQVWMKREDLNHPHIQGNKWHKLKLNLAEAQQQGNNTLITFGGAYSNHIAATAVAGKRLGFETVGYIRGEELAEAKQKWSPTLINAEKNDMQLKFLNRKEYRLKATPAFIKKIEEIHPNAYLIPEGGTNSLAIAGFKSMADEIQQQLPNWTHLFVAVGTGGTLAGLVKHLKPKKNQIVIGIPTANQYEYLIDDINHYLEPHFYEAWYFQTPKLSLRYGKIFPKITQTISNFKTEFNILLDPVYTARMVYEFLQALEQNQIPENAKVLLIHTGGLQGGG